MYLIVSYMHKYPLPYRTIVSKSGPPTKTTICSVSRGCVRRRNETKENLHLAFQFVRGRPGRKQIGRQGQAEDDKKLEKTDRFVLKHPGDVFVG